jgi:hypothetical protein
VFLAGFVEDMEVLRDIMFPESSVAAPLFAPVWSLVFIGALRSGNGPQFPFGSTWKRYVERALPSLLEIRDRLRRQCAFDSTIAEMLLEDWGRREQRVEERDQTDLDVAIAVAAGKIGQLPSTEEERIARIASAARRQCCALVDALLVAEKAAQLDGRATHPDAARDILWDARELAGHPLPHGDVSSEQLLAAVARDWKGESAEWRAERPESLDRWMSSRIDQLAVPLR